jgi:hypothetical protein
MYFGSAVCNHDPETSNECSVLHGALHPARSATRFKCSSADQAKGLEPGLPPAKLEGLRPESPGSGPGPALPGG